MVVADLNSIFSKNLHRSNNGAVIYAHDCSFLFAGAGFSSKGWFKGGLETKKEKVRLPNLLLADVLSFRNGGSDR